MTTKYPNSIDGCAQIRKARDTIDEIIASDHNALRSAVIAIEQTLGIKPQGPFGTVVERLNDAYNNIVDHATGSPPQHQDSVILSPERTGSIPSSFETLPYDLPSGTLASQLNRILVLLNDTSHYPGSSPVDFADGYTLPLSSVRDTITNIVRQLGNATGTEKIGGQAITGTLVSVTAGTLHSQLTTIVNTLDSLSTASSFTTDDGRYTFSSLIPQQQRQEAGEFLDERANLTERLFNACVVSGMDVSGSGGTATISSGYVLVNGRMLRYAGGTVSITDGSNNYISASASGDTVSVSSSTSFTTSATNPVVFLRHIFRSGASWTTDVDLRRYGMFSNDKDYFTVGDTPSSGLDGYGCDFTSLKSAVAYVTLLSSQNNLIVPKKIKLANDLTISSSAEAEIAPFTGMEIDGCGREISISVDNSLFEIDFNNIVIKDVHMVSLLGAPGTSLCFAAIGGNNNVDTLDIHNCKVTQGVESAPYFLRLGEAAGALVITNANISNNYAEVALGGIEYISTNKYHQVLTDSIIMGNNIRQGSFSSTSYAGIKAGPRCIVSNNIVYGGFESGILLTKPNLCTVDANLILGFFSATIYMDSGIQLWNNSAGDDLGCVVSNNVIKGVDRYGIHCDIGTASGDLIYISDNFIDNFDDVGTSPIGMVGIWGTGDECYVSGNYIVAPGAFAIKNAQNIVGNNILGKSAITTTTAAIELGASGNSSIVSDNNIINVSGNGIDINNNTHAMISNNLLTGLLTSDYAITNTGADNSIIGNFLVYYQSGYINVDSNRCLISGNFIDSYTPIVATGYNGITLSNSDYSSVVGNYLYQAPNGIVVDSSSSNVSICNNYIIESQDEYGIGVSGDYCSINSNYLLSDTGDSVFVGGSYTQVNNNNIDSSGNCGIKTYGGASELMIQGNHITDTTSSAIELNGTAYSLVTGNYIHNPGVSGVYINISGQSSVCSNWIFSPADTGIELSGNCSASLIQGNWIRDAVNYGILVSSSSDQVSIVGNYLTRCGGSAVAQIDLINCTNFVCVGNQVVNPTNIFSCGINMTGSTGGLLVGNRAEGGSSDSGIDYSSADGYVIDANLSVSGSDPGNWNIVPHVGDDNGYDS